MTSLRLVLLVCLLLSAALAGCSTPDSTPAPTGLPAETAESPGATAPTETPAPTSAPEATDPPEPTRTPRPTDSPDDAADNDNSGGDEDEERDNQSSRSTPDASRGQGSGEGQDRGSRDSQPADLVELDVCTLLTEEEATEAVDNGDEFEFGSGVYGCTYFSTNRDADTFVSVGLSAYQDDEARWMLSVLIATVSLFQDSEADVDIEDLIEEIRDEVEDMSLEDIFEEMLLPLYEDFGFDVDDADDQGADAAYWAWYEDSSTETGFGEMIVLRDDAYIMIDLTGLEDRDSENAAEVIAEIALDRLPERFSVLPDDYEDMLTPQP